MGVWSSSAGRGASVRRRVRIREKREECGEGMVYVEPWARGGAGGGVSARGGRGRPEGAIEILAELRLGSRLEIELGAEGVVCVALFVGYSSKRIWRKSTIC